MRGFKLKTETIEKSIKYGDSRIEWERRKTTLSVEKSTIYENNIIR